MSDLQTDVRKATGLKMDAIAGLRTKIRGDIIQPGDPQYDTARKVYNAMIDKHPAIIVRCVDAADVSNAVNFGCEQGLDIAVRGGSHNGPGFGTVEGGLVIDLSRMRGIRVDPEAKTVRVEGGAVWGDVDHATYPFGLAVPTGFLSTTGVGGLTLGGGIGYLARRYGLTIDNLLSVDMVLADGCFVTADKDHNEDLFWAVRGGGGNFGIVTSFLYRGNPVSTVYGGPMIWSLEDSADILAYWQDLILRAPEELNGWFAFLTIPPAAPFPEKYHLQKMCAVVWCYTGPLEKAEGCSNLFGISVSLPSILSDRSHSRTYRVCLMQASQQACSGIGSLISSIVLKSMPLICMLNMVSSCPPRNRLCTFTQSMGHQSGSERMILPGVTGMRILRR